MSLRSTLSSRMNQIQLVNKPVRINTAWEEAAEFVGYIGLEQNKSTVAFVLRLFKTYGKNKVLNLRSWLKDTKIDPKRFQGLMHWKLKQLQKGGI